MVLKPIRFSSLHDVYDLLDKLKALKLLTFESNMSCVTVLNAAALNAQFIVGDDFETYLLYDIFQLSDEEMLATQVTFSSRPHLQKSSIPINKYRIWLQDYNESLLHNIPLVNALCQINPNKDQFLNLQMPFDPSTHRPIVYPLLNHLEQAVDAIETIKSVLASNKEIQTINPKSLDVLKTVRWYVPNFALAELQRLIYEQMQVAAPDAKIGIQLIQTCERAMLTKESLDALLFNAEDIQKLPKSLDKKDNDNLMTRIDEQRTTLRKDSGRRDSWFLASGISFLSLVGTVLAPEFLIVALVYKGIASADKKKLWPLFDEFNNEQLAKIDKFIVAPMREHLQFFIDKAPASKSSSPLQQLSFLKRKSSEYQSASEQSSFTASL